MFSFYICIFKCSPNWKKWDSSRVSRIYLINYKQFLLHMRHSEITFIGDFTCDLKFGPSIRTVKPMLGIVVQRPPPKRNMSEPSQVHVCGEICAPKSLCFPFVWSVPGSLMLVLNTRNGIVCWFKMDGYFENDNSVIEKTLWFYYFVNYIYSVCFSTKRT